MLRVRAPSAGHWSLSRVLLESSGFQRDPTKRKGSGKGRSEFGVQVPEWKARLGCSVTHGQKVCTCWAGRSSLATTLFSEKAVGAQLSDTSLLST